MTQDNKNPPATDVATPDAWLVVGAQARKAFADESEAITYAGQWGKVIPLAKLTPATSSGVDIQPHVREFLGKVQGVCMALVMSGDDHPNPDGALLELFNEAQAILFPAATAAEGSTDAT